jgi:hemerythrin superfamily protein
MRTESSKGERYDALEVLKSQHREVEDLFSQFEKTKDEKECYSVAQTICQKLEVHSTIEEELLYPTARSQGRDGEFKDIVLESLEEHLSVERIVADVMDSAPGDERLRAKINVLKEQVLHHVKEEEHDLFPRLKKEIPAEERQTLGEQLLARTQELSEDIEK